MFTGIIETTGVIEDLKEKGNNISFRISSDISKELNIDQSLNHDGVCLTVEEVGENWHWVTAIAETLDVTNLRSWKKGDIINLERCLRMDSRLDGHLVQGHVDTVANCESKKEKDGSWEFEFSFPRKFSSLVIEKGSIAVNGISLTAFNVKKKTFTVAIIPFTYDHSNIKFMEPGEKANLEFDLIGKYILRRLSLK
jgi:riboflavin synthase